MHCAGFEVSYCCIILPYSDVQAQAVRSGVDSGRSALLAPDDGIMLHYAIRDNSYSEGNRMRYWRVIKDVRRRGIQEFRTPKSGIKR
ncbi:MAG TPA: hypothetical protein VFG29_01550 [Syntrophales bacterium]|nr:hypothetical protein [Syntrophales bacterium]